MNRYIIIYYDFGGFADNFDDAFKKFREEQKNYYKNRIGFRKPKCLTKEKKKKKA